MYSLFICLLPSLLGVKLLSNLTEKKEMKELVINYLLLVLFSNLLCLTLVILLNKFDGNIVEYINNHLMFSVKYVVLLIVVNILLSFVFSFFIKYLKITLEVKYEKNKQKNN